jgi:hypothetical protein
VGPARCEYCARRLTLAECLSCAGQRGRLSYPRRRPDGSRAETAYNRLCQECLDRAEQYRQEGTVRNAVEPAQHEDAFVRRGTIFFTGLGCGIILTGMIAQLWQSAPMTGRPAEQAGAQMTRISNGGALPVTNSANPRSLPKRLASPPRAGSASLAVIQPAKVSSQPSEREPRRAVAAGVRKTSPSLEVDNLHPQQGRGIRITLHLPEGSTAIQAPFLQMQDAKGRSYRSVMHPGNADGEWYWASGLDVAGRWRGAAVVPVGEKLLSVPLPRIIVTPSTLRKT